MSVYSRRMAALGAKIFGEVTRPTSQPGRRVYRLFMEKPLEKDPQFTQYYPKHIEITSLMKRLRALGLYRDEHQDFKDEMKRLRALRGKVKPKKGEGKRAQKKIN